MAAPRQEDLRIAVQRLIARANRAQREQANRVDPIPAGSLTDSYLRLIHAGPYDQNLDDLQLIDQVLAQSAEVPLRVIYQIHIAMDEHLNDIIIDVRNRIRADDPGNDELTLLLQQLDHQAILGQLDALKRLSNLMASRTSFPPNDQFTLEWVKSFISRLYHEIGYGTAVDRAPIVSVQDQRVRSVIVQFDRSAAAIVSRAWSSDPRGINTQQAAEVQHEAMRQGTFQDDDSPTLVMLTIMNLAIQSGLETITWCQIFRLPVSAAVHRIYLMWQKQSSRTLSSSVVRKELATRPYARPYLASVYHGPSPQGVNAAILEQEPDDGA